MSIGIQFILMKLFHFQNAKQHLSASRTTVIVSILLMTLNIDIVNFHTLNPLNIISLIFVYLLLDRSGFIKYIIK